MPAVHGAGMITGSHLKYDAARFPRSNKKEISGPIEIADRFCDYFTYIGLV